VKTALITGASSGLGKEFSYLLAEKGYNVLLVARTEDKLSKIAEDISAKYKINANYIVMDLAEINSAELLFTKVKEKSVDIDVLINNAGFGKFGNFLKYDLDIYKKMSILNSCTVMALIYLFGKEMAKRGKGNILNVSSTAAFQPIPLFAVYAATKSYVLSLSAALQKEFKEKGVTITTLCPGPTATNFGITAETRNTKIFNPGKVMDARFVAKEGLKGLFNGDLIIIPGRFNKFLAFLSRHFPVKFIMFVINKVLG
jgi:short-subunit dehydrogenase